MVLEELKDWQICVVPQVPACLVLLLTARVLLCVLCKLWPAMEGLFGHIPNDVFEVGHQQQLGNDSVTDMARSRLAEEVLSGRILEYSSTLIWIHSRPCSKLLVADVAVHGNMLGKAEMVNVLQASGGKVSSHETKC